MQANRRGEAEIELPQVVYQGRVAMVMRRLQAEGIARTLQRLQTMGGLDAAVLDHVDMDRAFRLAARLDGVPEDLLRPEVGVKRLRRRREAAAAAQSEPAPPAPLP
jgi:hypothetical protein